MDDGKRIEKAYLENMLQSLHAAVAAMSARVNTVLSLLPEGDGGVGDAEHMQRALAAMLEALGEFSRDEGADDTGLSRLRHDLRNSIGIVEGYAEMLLEDHEEPKLCAELREIPTMSRRFQASLDGFRVPAIDDESTDPIASIFKSFRRGLGGAQRSTEPATLLVVDDNESSRELLAQQLQRQDHLVIEAASGERCLEVMRSASPDLVLLDLVMPGLNGYEVLQEIRRDEQLRRIPVVVISGVQDEGGAIHCIDAGASDYLIKPVNATLLTARVSALLERKAWQDREREYLAELEKSQRFIRKVFGRYLSDEIVQRLLDNSDGLSLGGERRRVTVLMADIRDFSLISMRLEPERCVALLNNYLAVMTEVIQGFRGTVDEFVGDGILAVFGAPVSEEDDSDRALACAVAMQQAMAEVNRRNEEEGLPLIEIGIGLNTGDVVAGNIGSELRSKYGVVGHNVNLTSRIESCTVGGQILASPATLDLSRVEVLRGSQFDVVVKGLDEPLKLTEVLGVGLPYDLLLEGADVRWKALASSPENVRISLLSGKRVSSERIAVKILAVRSGALRLSIPASLELPADVCLFGVGSDGLYGKLVQQEGDCYVMKITTHSQEASRLLEPLIAPPKH